MFKDARFGGHGGVYYGNNNKQRKDGNRVPRRDDADENPQNDQDPYPDPEAGVSDDRVTEKVPGWIPEGHYEEVESNNDVDHDSKWGMQ